ncbi:MAG: aminotransferase class III-fold pyridoxal phosphate-dependent enzyme, partial [Armatimonadetes bacterium]|nr:aminotransferase class III-fold pyridoxal phosphate-dependent enzyme [Armatimonadota bacterium]
RDAAQQPVEFLPEPMIARMESLLQRVGDVLTAPAPSGSPGASTRAFNEATRTQPSPVSAFGWYRVGEDGRLYLITKSEHYHAAIGHAFPGFALLDTARRLGIPNATHNSTRGHITRTLERELVRAANGVGQGDVAEVIASPEGQLNRVLNLETGSLAVEAAFKMCMARFYAHEPSSSPPRYAGRTPVFLVVGDDAGRPFGNYHGTTALVQALRGLWPGLSDAMEERGLMRVCAVRPNVASDLDAAFERWERPPHKIAAFFHEIVMMNYGARVLSREFMTHAYDLCDRHDVPTVADEIQTCLWAPGLFMFREHGLRPGIVAVGKGFPGGEYGASRVLLSAEYDQLGQFGALVTNGQEELASLAYLVTMEWASANEAAIRRLGDLYAARLADLAAAHPGVLDAVEGSRHMSALRFHELDAAKDFARRLNERGLDISAQAYKADCPPVVLTKLPIIATERMIEFVVGRMAGALGELA